MKFLERLTNDEIKTFFANNGVQVASITAYNDFTIVKGFSKSDIMDKNQPVTCWLTNFKIINHNYNKDLSNEWYTALKNKFGKKYIMEYEQAKNQNKEEELSK